MAWIDLLVLILLALSFFGGLKDGAVKSLFSLLILIIAIPFAGRYFSLIASPLAFLPANWQNFIAFFVTLALISLVLHLVLFLPRKFVQTVWKEGAVSRLLGGGANVLNASIGMVLFTIVLGAYPILDWLLPLLRDSAVLAWLVAHLGFVAALLPGVFQKAAGFMTYH